MKNQRDELTCDTCDIYSVFEASHIVKLNRQAKNQEHKAIINEIREAAKKRLTE